MDHEISKPSNWRSKVCVVLQTQPEVPFVGIQASRIDSEFLYLYGFEEEKLLQPIINELLLKELLKLVLQVIQVVSLELNP